MSHDTSSDPRIVVAEIALAGLAGASSALPRQHSKRLEPLVGRLRQAIPALRYSFLPPEEAVRQGLLEPIEEVGLQLCSMWSELAGLQKPAEQLAASWVRFAGITLRGLRRRLVEGEPRFADAVEALWAKVTYVKSLNDRLSELEMDAAKEGKFRVVTNLPGVKRGDLRAFAVLPPRRIGGVVSQGMLVDSDVEGEPGSRARPAGRSEGEVEAVLREEAKRLGVRI